MYMYMYIYIYIYVAAPSGSRHVLDEEIAQEVIAPDPGLTLLLAKRSSKGAPAQSYQWTCIDTIDRRTGVTSSDMHGYSPYRNIVFCKIL